MRLSRFYTAQELIVGANFSLGKDLAHYLRNVLRSRPGDQIILFNGAGGEYLAQLDSVQKREVTVSIQGFDPVEAESPLSTRLGISVVKRDAMDNILQKSTELGVTEIQPLISDLTTVCTKAIKQRDEHWRQIIISACEQCGRNTLPRLLAPVESLDWLQRQDSELKLALDPSGNHSPMDIGLSENKQPGGISVLIGPEGGLSERELALAAASEFLLIALGKRILRADTAPVAVLSILQSRFGDLRSAAKATRQTSDSI